MEVFCILKLTCFFIIFKNKTYVETDWLSSLAKIPGGRNYMFVHRQRYMAQHCLQITIILTGP